MPWPPCLYKMRRAAPHNDWPSPTLAASPIIHASVSLASRYSPLLTKPCPDQTRLTQAALSQSRLGWHASPCLAPALPVAPRPPRRVKRNHVTSPLASAALPCRARTAIVSRPIKPGPEVPGRNETFPAKAATPGLSPPRLAEPIQSRRAEPVPFRPSRASPCRAWIGPCRRARTGPAASGRFVTSLDDA